MNKRRAVRVSLTLLITGLCLTYILWQLDVARTLDILLDAHLGWFLGAVAVMLGGVPPLTLAAIGFALALGHYDVGAYLWIEGAFVLGTIVLGVMFFSHSARG